MGDEEIRYTNIPFETMFGRQPGSTMSRCLKLMGKIADQMRDENKTGSDHMAEYLARVDRVQSCRQCPIADDCLSWKQRRAYLLAQEKGVGLGPLFGGSELYVLKYG